MLCGRRFEAFLANTSQTGAAIVRNIFSIVGYGAYWLPADALLAWKDAGWEPLLRDIAGECGPGRRYHDGPYRPYFLQFTAALLEGLPRCRETTRTRRLCLQ